MTSAEPSIPTIPTPTTLWAAVRTWIWIVYAILILAAVPDFFVQYWFTSSLGFSGVFWTNLTAQLLFGVAFAVVLAAAIVVPIRRYSPNLLLRRAASHAAAWVALLGGWRAAEHYQTVLLAMYGVPFGKTDPVFGHDIGFYVYTLPAIELVLQGIAWSLAFSMLATVVARFDAARARGLFDDRSELTVAAKIGVFCPPWFRALWDVEGAVVAVMLFTLRYSLLFKNNEDSGVRVGAQYLDV